MHLFLFFTKDLFFQKSRNLHVLKWLGVMDFRVKTERETKSLWIEQGAIITAPFNF